MRPVLNGRPLGIRNKVSKRFLEDVYESWQKHGRDVLEVLWSEKPVEYARLVAGVLPKELIFEPALEIASVEELDAIIGAIKQHVLSKPGEPLLIEGETINEPDSSSAGAVDGDIGAGGSAQTATPRRGKMPS